MKNMRTMPRLQINWRVNAAEQLGSESDMASPMLKSTQSRLSTLCSPMISPRKCPSTPTCLEDEDQDEELCQNFRDYGYCQNGRNCPFIHLSGVIEKMASKRLLEEYPEIVLHPKNSRTRSFLA